MPPVAKITLGVVVSGFEGLVLGVMASGRVWRMVSLIVVVIDDGGGELELESSLVVDVGGGGGGEESVVEVEEEGEGEFSESE